MTESSLKDNKGVTKLAKSDLQQAYSTCETTCTVSSSDGAGELQNKQVSCGWDEVASKAVAVAYNSSLASVCNKNRTRSKGKT